MRVAVENFVKNHKGGVCVTLIQVIIVMIQLVCIALGDEVNLTQLAAIFLPTMLYVGFSGFMGLVFYLSGLQRS